MQLKELENFLQNADYSTIQELSDKIFPAILCAESDILKYAKFREDTYCRNEINIGNPKFSLVIIGWNPGQFSPIHNHPCEGCIVIPFKGNFKEIKYNAMTLTPTESNIFKVGQVSYIDDSLGLHSLGNPSKTEKAVSLHIYSPGLFKAQIFKHEKELAY